MRKFDVFLSYASQDRESVVLPLAKALQARGPGVWLDQEQLKMGDVLSERIDEGLARARFGVVILSHAFFARQWPRRELDALVTRETSSGIKVILPVWHGLGFEEVAAYSLTLAGRLAAETSQGINSVVDHIIEALNADHDESFGETRGSVRLSSAPGAKAIPSGAPRPDDLIIRSSLEFQAPMRLVHSPSDQIEWLPSLQLINTGTKLMALYDILPLPPVRVAEGGAEPHEVQLVRSDNFSYELYESLGAMSDSARERFHGTGKREDWPLVVKPGERVRAVLSQRYQLLVDGSAVTFRDNEMLLQWLGSYFGLEPTEDGGFQIGSARFATRIVCQDFEWEMGVVYGTYVVGTSFHIPAEALAELGKQSRLRRWVRWFLPGPS